jgi:two-component system CheB/CheR fusion protein
MTDLADSLHLRDLASRMSFSWRGGEASESDRYLRNILDVIPAAIYATDSTGLLTYYNGAAAALWGHHPELGTSVYCGSWKLYWPDGRAMAHAECPMAVTLREKRPIRGLDAIAERPDGTRVPFLPYPTPLFDDAGNLIGAVNMLVDISDRERAAAQAQYLASIVESSEDAIVSKDLDGIIKSWNRGAEQLFGYTAEEIVGKPVTVLIPEDRIDEEPAILDRVHRGERVEPYETVRRRKDGSLIDVMLTVSPLKDAGGRIVGASKIARDITDRKRAQERQELIVNEMRHRIKNSLATIQAIATQTLNEHAEERDAFIARLHALDSAHDLLTSEIWEKAQLEAIVTRVLQPFQGGHGERITIGGSAEVWFDSTTSVIVAMVIHELATNAIKHGALSNGSGHVTVGWERQRQPDRVTLVWRESGGPPVQPPSQKGFGSHLIERALASQAGATKLDFHPQGVVCTLEVAL